MQRSIKLTNGRVEESRAQGAVSIQASGEHRERSPVRHVSTGIQRGAQALGNQAQSRFRQYRHPERGAGPLGMKVEPRRGRGIDRGAPMQQQSVDGSNAGRVEYELLIACTRIMLRVLAVARDVVGEGERRRRGNDALHAVFGDYRVVKLDVKVRAVSGVSDEVGVAQ